MSRVPPLANFLPYLASRTIDTTHGRWGFLVLKDGTMVTGFEVGGRDVYCADDAVLEQVAASFYTALNSLPACGYLQAVFETGLSFSDVVDDFAKVQCEGKLPLVQKARKHRLALLRHDCSLSRTRIVYYIGLRRALECQFRTKQSPLLARLLGKRHPQDIRALHVRAAAEQLAQAATQFIDALSAGSIPSWRLSELELLGECHSAVNPNRSKTLPPPFVLELKEDLQQIKPGERVYLRGPSLASQLPLGSMDVEPSFLHLENARTRVRTLSVQSYPGQICADSLFPIQFSHMPDTPARLVITHRATDRVLSKEALTTKRKTVGSHAGAHAADADAIAAYKDYMALLETLAETDARAFETTISAVATGESLRELDLATRKLENGFAEINFALVDRRNLQLQAWLATLPGAGYRAQGAYPLHTGNCSYLMPYARPAEGVREPADFVFRTRQRSVVRVSWRQTGAQDHRNTFIVGSIGSGKTFLASHMVKTILSLGGHVIITDVKGPANSTYRPLAALLGGQYIALDGAEHDVAFNPCPEHRFIWKNGEWTDEIDSLRKIVCMMAVPNYDTHPDQDFYSRVATDAICATYKATRDPERTPILSDVVRALEGYQPPTPHFGELAKDMALRLRIWCEDRKRGSLLNRPTSIDSTNPFQVFDFKNLDNDPALASVLISALSARMTNKMQDLPLSIPKAFVFDEAWSLFEHSQTAADLIGHTSRVVRSYGAFVVVLTQSYTDVSKSIAAAALMASTSIYVLNRANAQHAEAAEVFDLSPRQLDLYRTLEVRKGQFAEFLYFNKTSKESAVMQYVPTPWEMWVDTARAIDMELLRLVRKRLGDEQALDYLAKEYPHGATEEGLEHEKARETA